MNFTARSGAIRDGKFDVVIAAGPRLTNWPSIGVRTLSSICAEMGLTVGQFGGENVTVRGIIPLPVTGGLVLVQDIQKRIHRIHARAVVRISAETGLPDPFPGWRSQGHIPLSSAQKLCKESQIKWDPCTVILGTGNRALKFGSYLLLEMGVPEVYCVESYAQWGAKRFAGWEVERRQFEINGGKLIEAKPLQLIPKSPLLWQFRLQDSLGIRVLDVGRVVSAGPFDNSQRVREYPAGSLLFELEQTAGPSPTVDREGWAFEVERGRWLAGKIAKTLVAELGPKREELDPLFKRARSRLKRFLKHREEPFTPSYQGKWIHSADAKKIRNFGGVPQSLHQEKFIASVECFEEIPCDICQTVCPTSAIQIGLIPRAKSPILNESACTACGLCVAACPSGTISLIHERENRSTSFLTLPWRGKTPWVAGEFSTLVNRRGETLGSARISSVSPGPPLGQFDSTAKETGSQQLIQIEVLSHLLWEARGLKRSRTHALNDENDLSAFAGAAEHIERVEITLNGERRFVRDKIPISIALFEIGQGRPEDVLFCQDNSCGLCQISVDGGNKLACQTRIHRGMSIRTTQTRSASLNQQGLDPNLGLNLNLNLNLTQNLSQNPNQDHAQTQAQEQAQDHSLCPCLQISREQVIERLKQGQLHSAEAVLSVTRVGEGKCHGGLCMEAFERILREEGLGNDQWIDWRFPWADWTLAHD